MRGAAGWLRADEPQPIAGYIKVEQPGRELSGNEATVNRDCKGEVSSLDINGDVVLREPGKFVMAECAHVDLRSKAGYLMHAIYRFVLGEANPFTSEALTAPSPASSAQYPCSPQLPNAWGVAESVCRKESGIIELKGVSYTTCAPTSNTWRLSASQIDLDSKVGRGYAYNTILRAKGIPVFYTPYLNFPIDHRRQSGFLFPSTGSSSRSGFSVTVPYYFNLAPNYDATFFPTTYSKRGVLSKGEFRYLTENSIGTLSGGYIHHDVAFEAFKRAAVEDYRGNLALHDLLNSSINRGYFSWQNDSHLGEHWTSAINFNYVRDDYFIEDFNVPSVSVPNQLPRQFDINYRDTIWTFSGRLLAFQTLHPVNLAPISNSYESLPDIRLNADLPNQMCGLHYRLDDQFVYFTREKNPGEMIDPMSAKRFNIRPSVSWPVIGAPGFFIPKVQLDFTHYNIQHQVHGYNGDISRALPLFDIDSGLIFERYFNLCRCAFQQTLEPRIFYLYVPYRNQGDIPIFDTSLIPFSYDSLFLTNRFSSIDRIGDANQISASLTTRFLRQDNGEEKFRASIGQIFYFQNRRVTNVSPPGTPAAVSMGTIVIDPQDIIGATSLTEKISPLAGQVAYHFTPQWTFIGNGVWDPTEKQQRQLINTNLNLQYMPAPYQVMNLGYNFIRSGNPQPNEPRGRRRINDLSQVSFSFAWPLWERWHTVGGITYDIVHRYPDNYLYGLQYDSCCWAARIVAGRTFIGLNEHNNPIFDNAIYFQWQFKGLGNIGTANPVSLLVNSIPGYRDTFGNVPFFQ